MPIRNGTSYSGFVREHQQLNPGLYRQPDNKSYINQRIPSNDISESYLNIQKQPWQPHSAPNSTKGVRKFAPAAFFSRKKKTQEVPNTHGYATNDILDDDEDDTHIARLEDFDQESINPVFLGQLDDSQLNTVEDQGKYEKMYQRRVEYILSHYEKPPAYPGSKKDNNTLSKQGEQIPPRLDQDTPLLKQLLKDKQLTDNTSMNNFCQVSPSHRNHQFDTKPQGDKLVTRTQNNPLIKTENPKELFEKRQQHYMFKIKEIDDTNLPVNNHDRDAISEIVYPAKDYEFNQSLQKPTPMSMSASVPDLSMNKTKHMENINFQTTPRKKPRGLFVCCFEYTLLALITPFNTCVYYAKTKFANTIKGFYEKMKWNALESSTNSPCFWFYVSDNG